MSVNIKYEPLKYQDRKVYNLPNAKWDKWLHISILTLSIIGLIYFFLLEILEGLLRALFQ